jgi:hypothetical protein
LEPGFGAGFWSRKGNETSNYELEFCTKTNEQSASPLPPQQLWQVVPMPQTVLSPQQGSVPQEVNTFESQYSDPLQQLPQVVPAPQMVPSDQHSKGIISRVAAIAAGSTGVADRTVYPTRLWSAGIEHLRIPVFGSVAAMVTDSPGAADGTV